jgi:hypothetical protein
MIASRVTIIATSALLAAYAPPVAKAADAPGFYHQISELKLGGTGTSWDHIDYDQASHRAYISRRADGLTVVDVTTNAVVGQVSNAMGSGASAIVPKLDRGFTANTDGSTSIFKLSDLSPVDRISFGDNFDGVVYDAATNILAYQQADNSKELLVDAATMKLVGTIEVEGTQLERPVVDNKSNLYMPLRDKHVVYKVSLKDKKIIAKWDVSSKCTEPSGSEFDVANNRLLLPCRGKQLNPVLAVIDADTGVITGTAISGRGSDDVILDPATKQLFISAGVDGVLTVYKQESADKYTLTEALQTRPGLRVIRYDSGSQKIFGVTAEGIFNASKKNLAGVSPFYANAYTPGTFVMLTYSR